MKEQLDYKDKTIKQYLIMDHYSNPKNKGIQKNPHAIILRKSNQSCMDDIVISLIIKDNLIIEGHFEGIGCALTYASTDIMLDLLRNKTLLKAKKLLTHYQEMVHTGNTKYEKELGELIIFMKINEHPNRMNCVLLSSEIIKNIINKKKVK